MICPLALFLIAAVTDNFSAAKSALAEGLPAVAINKLESSPLTDKETVLLLARATLEDGQAGRTLELLKGHPVGPLGDFLAAQAYAALGQWEMAIGKYRASQKDPTVGRMALIGQARMARNLERPEEALAILEPSKEWPPDSLRRLADLERAENLLAGNHPLEAQRVLESMEPAEPAERMRRDYLLARGFSLSGKDAAALKLYDALKPLDPAMAIGMVCGQARALRRIGQSPIAESLLEDFISKNPNVPGLEEVFPILDSLYAAQPSASPSELKRWADDQKAKLRSKLAGIYLARYEARLGREDRVEKILQDVVEGAPDTPALAEAFQELAKIRLKQGRPNEALELLPATDASAPADFLRGLALSALRDPLGASAHFLSAASEDSLAEVALYNAAVCDLFSGGSESQGFRLLQERFPASARLDELRLRQAYELVRQNDASGPAVFEALSQTGGRRLASAANLALAEWEYAHNDRSSALAHLRRISTSEPDAKDAQADALSVFLLDDGRSDEAAISAAKSFLATHEGASAEPEVMLKLGELLYRKGDFSGARVQLESLAKKYPGTPMEAHALFLAAQSAARLQTASSVNDAMLLFEEVASSSGPLALRARFEQAVLQNVIGKPGEAVVILDRIIASDASPEMKAAALIEKGKTFYGLGPDNPKSYQDAIAVWRLVVAAPDSSPVLRNQALARIGSAYENLGDSDSALAAYHDVLKEGKDAPLDYFWFYKAGFAAARLLESSKRWDQAIRVYEMIAAAGGPRSGEAAERINKIRLENFLWDEAPAS